MISQALVNRISFTTNIEYHYMEILKVYPNENYFMTYGVDILWIKYFVTLPNKTIRNDS